MYWHDMNGWHWLWGTLMMVSWIVLVGLVVYVAVRLAHRDSGPKSHP